MKLLCSSTLVFVTILHVSCAFLFNTTYKGSLLPVDPIACVSQEVTFTCTLLDNPVENKTILFYAKSHSDSSAYHAAEETDVTVVNTSVSQYTVNVTEIGYTAVKCYYSEPNKGTKPNRTFQLGKTSTIQASSVSKPKVTDINCVVENFVDHMNCSWKDEGYYEEKPLVTFHWRIPNISLWQTCPDLNSEKHYCYSNSTVYGDFSTKIIEVKIEITYRTCGKNVPVRATYNDTVDTRKTNKPNPVDNLTSLVINSTCIKLDWSTRNSRPEYHKIQEIKASSERDSKEVQIYTESSTHNYIFCGLNEYTVYTFTIKIKPKGPKYDGYWSDEKSTEIRTSSAVPSASPAVARGGYSWNPHVCRSEQKRRVCFMLQSIAQKDENGEMKELKVSFNNNSQSIAEDSLYFCKDLLCKESYRMTITPYNDAGGANKTSVISVEKWTDGIVQPTLKVERTDTTNKTGNHTVHLQWSNPPVANAIGYNVFHCTKDEGGCKKNDGVMEWQFYSKDTHEVYMDVDSTELSFGVSLITDTGSSGLQWETCVFTKGVCPTKAVQNVVVSTGSEDDTLVVNWDKLQCQSGEPYINNYRITYCKVSTGTCKDQVVAADLGRIVLYELEGRYSVKVKGGNEVGCYGPDSEIMHGTPEHKALKSGEIIGIVMACLVVVFMAGVGLFCCLRRSNRKFKVWKKKAGAVRLPYLDGREDPNSTTIHEMDPPYDEIEVSAKSLGRQDSKDSGVPLTPKTDENFECLPNGYCICHTTNKSDKVDDDRMNLSNAERHNTLTARNEHIVAFVHDIPTPGHVAMIPTPSLLYVQSSETPNKERALPHDYNKATITGNVNQDDSENNKDERNQSDTGVNSNCPAEKLIKLTSIPKPECYSACSAEMNSYVKSPVAYGGVSSQVDHKLSDYVKSLVHNASEISHSDQISNSTESQVQSSANISNSDQIDSYVKSPVEYGGDEPNSPKISNTVMPPVNYDCDNAITDRVSDAYIKSLIQYDADTTRSDLTSDSYVKSPIQYDADTTRSDLTSDSYVKSPIQYDADTTCSDLTSDSYVKSPIQYDADTTRSDLTSDSYVKSPIQYDGDTTRSDLTSDSYVKSPIQYDADTTRSDLTSDSYVKSPIQYDGDTTRSDLTSDSYVKSPIQYDADTTRSDLTSDSYVKSPIQYDADTTRSDLTSDSYVKSPIQYDGDTTRSDLTSDSYVKSPIQYDADTTRPDLTSDSYVKSPIQYDGDTTRSDLTSDSYVKSPIQYDGDTTRSDLTSDSYVKSPIQYDGDTTRSGLTSDSYVKSPIQYDGDTTRSDLTSDSYVKSPIQYDGDTTRSDLTSDSYVKSPIQYDGDTRSGLTSDSYVKSPIQYDGDTTRSGLTSDSYVKSPIQYDGDTTRSDLTSDSYVKSPIQYDADTTRSDLTSDSYVKSPIQYDGDTTRSDLTSDSYVKSPIQYNGDTTRSDLTSDSYVKSPIQYDGDTTRSDLTSDSYVKSPIQYDADTTRSDLTSDSYVKSPIQYDGDTSRSDLTSDSYVKSPIQYDGDTTRSDLTSDSYVKSPIQYDGDTRSDLTSDSYVKSPIQYDGDTSRSDLTSGSYVKSPIQYGGDSPNLKQILNQCNETTSTPLSDTKPPSSKAESSDYGTSKCMNLDDTLSHENNNAISQNICTPLTTTTPYVDINKKEIPNNEPINTLTYDNTAFLELEDDEDSEVNDTLSAITMYEQSLDQNKTVSVEKNKGTANQTTSDYIDISKMESLGNRSQIRTISDASDSSDDSLFTTKMELEGKTQTRCNSDSGLSSIENGAVSD